MSPKKAKEQKAVEDDSTDTEEIEEDSDEDVIEDVLIEELEVIDDEDEVLDDDIDVVEEDESEEAEAEDEGEEEQPRRRVPVQRSPMGKDEPPPPFAIGERVILTQNTRPRTGTPIGPYPVGSQGTVEAVLSLTAIVRFDEPPQSKEVVAFTCLKSAEKSESGSKKKD